MFVRPPLMVDGDFVEVILLYALLRRLQTENSHTYYKKQNTHTQTIYRVFNDLENFKFISATTSPSVNIQRAFNHAAKSC